MTSLDLLEGRLAAIVGPISRAKPRFDVEPLPLAAPRSVEETCELVRLATTDKLRILPVGRGSKLAWCSTPGHVDFLLSTRNLQRVVSHVPDDGTITVEAGLGMEELASRCRRAGTSSRRTSPCRRSARSAGSSPRASPGPIDCASGPCATMSSARARCSPMASPRAAAASS